MSDKPRGKKAEKAEKNAKKRAAPHIHPKPSTLKMDDHPVSWRITTLYGWQRSKIKLSIFFGRPLVG
jgi:hypothetical protein